jgi:predicted amidohydrolase
MKNVILELFCVLYLLFVSCETFQMDRSNEIFEIQSDIDNEATSKLALIQLEMLRPQNPEQQIANAFAAIDSAGRRGAELIVLPEGVNLGAGGKLQYRQVAVSIDSPLLEQVAGKAQQYQCYIVFPFIEKETNRIFNSAALFGRSGNLLGVYRKVHEPRCVVLNEGVSLGSDFPVFDTDIGRIGILICYDTISPEPALIYGLTGVDLIVYPHMIQPLKNEYFHITTRAKAIDASLYIAAAGWARPPEEAGGPLSATCLIDWEGTILAQGSRIDPMIVFHDVNLCRPRITEGLGVVEKAEWRKLFWGERRPLLYQKLIENNDEWRAWCPANEK